jgi:hypothetical protein
VNRGPVFWLIMAVGGAVLFGVALTYSLISRRGRRLEEFDRPIKAEPDEEDLA